MALNVGQEVLVGRGKYLSPAVVVAVGGCGWDRCPNGDDCVTVLEEGRSTTTNWSPESVSRPQT